MQPRKQMWVDEEALNRALANASLDAATVKPIYEAIGFYLPRERRRIHKTGCCFATTPLRFFDRTARAFSYVWGIVSIVIVLCHAVSFSNVSTGAVII
jgi:hypothetical protein